MYNIGMRPSTLAIMGLLALVLITALGLWHVSQQPIANSKPAIFEIKAGNPQTMEEWRSLPNLSILKPSEAIAREKNASRLLESNLPTGKRTKSVGHTTQDMYPPENNSWKELVKGESNSLNNTPLTDPLIMTIYNGLPHAQ